MLAEAYQISTVSFFINYLHCFWLNLKELSFHSHFFCIARYLLSSKLKKIKSKLKYSVKTVWPIDSPKRKHQFYWYGLLDYKYILSICHNTTQFIFRGVWLCRKLNYYWIAMVNVSHCNIKKLWAINSIRD